MSNGLNLGLGISFDDSQLKQLNSILTYVQKLQKQFDSMGDPLKKTKQVTTDFSSEMAKVNANAMKLVKTVENVGKSTTQTFEKTRNQIVQVTKSTDGTVIGLKNIHRASQSITESLGHNILKMAEWAISGMALYGTFRAITDAIKAIADIETELVNIKKVLPDDSDFASLSKGAQIISQQYGVAIASTMKAMQAWSRQIKDTNAIIELTNASMLVSSVTDITLESSYKSLSAVMAQFNMQVSDSNHVIDAWNELSNHMRSSAEDLAQGMAKTGAAAKLMNVTFDQTNAMIGTMVETLGTSGSQAGTILNRLFSRVHAKKTVAVLKDIGINAFQPMSKSLDQIGYKWNQYSKSEQEAIAKSLGGMHHWQKIATLFSNWNRVIEATLMSFNSYGSAQKEQELALSTYNKKVEQLKSTWQSFIVNVGNGVLPILKNIVDGLKYLITVGDGVVVKVGLITAAFLALKSVMTALFVSGSLATGGWLAVIATAVTVLATLGGQISNTTNKIQQFNNILTESNQKISTLNQTSEHAKFLQTSFVNLTEKVNKLDKKSKEYSDTLNLQQKVMKQIDDLSSQYGIKADPQLSKYDQRIDKINQLIDKLKELEVIELESKNQKIDDRVKEINSQLDANNSMIKLLKEYQKIPQQDVMGRMMKGWEIESSILKDPNLQPFEKIWKYLKSGDHAENLSTLTGENQTLRGERERLRIEKLRNGVQLGMFGLDDPDEDWTTKTTGLKDKIQPIFTTLTAETLTSIEKIGRSWQNQINSVLSEDAKLKDDRATYVLKGQDGLLSQSSDINNKMRADLLKPFEDIDKAAKSLKDTLSNIDTQRAKMKATGEYNPQAEVGLQRNIGKAYDDYQVKLQEQYKSLAKLGIELDISSEGFKYLTKEMNKLEEAMKEANDKANAQNDLIKQYNVITGTLDGVADVLDKFGGSVERAAATVLRSFSKMTAMGNGKISFDWKNMSKADKGSMVAGIASLVGEAIGKDDRTKEYTAQGAQMGAQVGGGWGAAIGAILGYGYGNMKRKRRLEYNPYERQKYSLSPLSDAVNSKSDQLNQIENYKQQISATQKLMDEAAKENERQRQSGHFGNVTPLSGYSIQIENLQTKIKQINDSIIANLDKWVEALGASVDDIANSINDAFRATNYMDFLTNWNQSLYTMTRDALIKGFLAQSAYQGLYRSLSDTIGMAVIDGVLDSTEIDAIKSQGNAIANAMQPLYQALNLLEGAFPGVSQNSSEQSYQAGSSVPITYNNYITIQSMAFAGNEDEAREFALLLNDYVVAEQGRG